MRASFSAIVRGLLGSSLEDIDSLGASFGASFFSFFLFQRFELEGGDIVVWAEMVDTKALRKMELR